MSLKRLWSLPYAPTRKGTPGRRRGAGACTCRTYLRQVRRSTMILREVMHLGIKPGAPGALQ